MTLPRYAMIVVPFLSCLAIFAGADERRPDILFEDFEHETYGSWTVTGTAFGSGPAQGTLPHQMPVTGYTGKRLVNSFLGGDRATGTLTSPAFKIERKYISFLIGGGGYEGKTCVNLLVDGKIVRSATGPNLKPGGSEALDEAGWDVIELAGKSAQIQVIDDATGGWGHINLDRIIFTDAKPHLSAPLIVNPSRQIVAQHRFLNLPVTNGGKIRNAKVSVDGAAVREFTIECADDATAADWWASLDVSAWQGKTLAFEVDKLPEGSKFLDSIEQSDSRKGMETLYAEPLRPQLHFSPSRGWNNDPNGLAYYGGEYHLFFQYNPYGTKWGNMHWGHAVSKDLVHWKEVEIALYPDPLGPMFSGSAVVDWKNSSGQGAAGQPPLVLIYTAAGHPGVQCIASSIDGRTFSKYAQNPVVPHISGGNRDPKVIWHEPTKQWVMCLYVDFPVPKEEGEAGGVKKEARRTIHFLTSPDLKQWTDCSEIEGFHECPDLFALPVDGNAKNVKWVLTAANSDYMVGQFDGKTFTPDQPEKIKGHRGRGFYAAQTFSDIPATDGRRIQIGWFQTPSPGMPFNQSMTVPLELSLLSTPEGPRLAWAPVAELEALRVQSKVRGDVDLSPDSNTPTLFIDDAGELLDVRCEVAPAAATEIELTVRGIPIHYDVARQELTVHGKIKAPAPLRDGKLHLTVLADRNSFEVFASDGLTYVPYPVIARPEDRSVQLKAAGGVAKVTALEVHRLKSIW